MISPTSSPPVAPAAGQGTLAGPPRTGGRVHPGPAQVPDVGGRVLVPRNGGEKPSGRELHHDALRPQQLLAAAEAECCGPPHQRTTLSFDLFPSEGVHANLLYGTIR